MAAHLLSSLQQHGFQFIKVDTLGNANRAVEKLADPIHVVDGTGKRLINLAKKSGISISESGVDQGYIGHFGDRRLPPFGWRGRFGTGYLDLRKREAPQAWRVTKRRSPDSPQDLQRI